MLSDKKDKKYPRNLRQSRRKIILTAGKHPVGAEGVEPPTLCL